VTDVFVRPAIPQDAPAAVAVLRASITELCVEDHQNDVATLERWLRNKTLEHFLGWLADVDNYLVVAEIGEAMVGVGSFRKGGLLAMLYVLPGQQGLGVGHALLSELEEQAARWGEREISFTSSARARAFYERHGYVSAGEPQRKYGILQDYPYRKLLGP
jgi:GNAT superfamily N-acetyltransferase